MKPTDLFHAFFLMTRSLFCINNISQPKRHTLSPFRVLRQQPWTAMLESAVHMRNRTQQKNQAHTWLHSTQRHLLLMAYSYGTSGCEPNICTHDSSCFLHGSSWETLRHHCVCSCLCAELHVCVHALVFVCPIPLFYKLMFTAAHAQPPES